MLRRFEAQSEHFPRNAYFLARPDTVHDTMAAVLDPRQNRSRQQWQPER